MHCKVKIVPQKYYSPLSPSRVVHISFFVLHRVKIGSISHLNKAPNNLGEIEYGLRPLETPEERYKERI